MSQEYSDTSSTDATAAETAGTWTEDTQTSAEGTTATITEPEARTFTQADFDAYKRGLRDNMERDFRQRYSAKPEAEPRQPQTAPDPLATRVATLDLNYRIDRMQKQYPELTDEKALVAVLEAAAAIGDNASPEWLERNDVLDIAYRLNRERTLSAIDTKKIEQEAGTKAVAAYVASLKGKSAATPSPEGKGGAAPATKKKRLNDSEMTDAAIARLTAAEQA